MRTVIVVNGEQDWQPFLPGHDVRFCRLQTSRWLFHDNALWVFTHEGVLRVDAVLWRLGAVRPHPNHRAVLELIRLANVPCVNDAAVLLRGYDRLAMLNEVRAAGLPMLPLSVGVGERILERIDPELPGVVKVGNYHGGFGKARVLDAAAWADVRDLAFVSEEYVTVEPFIDYVRDVRCLAVGETYWAMERRSAGWKANVATTQYNLIPVPPILADYTERMMRHLGADVLGIDFLEQADGSFVTLESNDVPGLSGFPDAVRIALAERLRAKLSR